MSGAPILVLYTGGTIGMVPGDGGYVPASGFDRLMSARQAQLAPDVRDGLPRWRYQAIEPPIDSANMSQAHWRRMHEAIVAAVDEGVAGVLVLHGTDTLAYTAAALAFLLADTPIPVVLTGSMQPGCESPTDAWDNLFGALALWQQPLSAGVHVWFSGQRLDGVRATKFHSERLDAFQVVARPQSGSLPRADIPEVLCYRQPCSEVPLAVLPFYPGLQAAQVGALLATGVRGMVLECYGTGTGPSDDPAMLETLQQAHAQGVVLVAISQCPAGAIESGVYAAGDRLFRTGLVNGGAMTREAALGKLFALLGRGLSAGEARHWMQQNLCGEQGGGVC